MTATEYRDYVDKLDGTQLPVLGSHLFTGVPDSIRVTADALRTAITNHGLPSTLAPKEIDAANAFRKATGRERFKLGYAFGRGTAEVTCRPVVSDHKRIVRHIVREVRMPRDEKLVYEPRVGTVTFFKSERKADGSRGLPVMTIEIADNIRPDERDVIRPALKALRADYEDLCVHYDGNAIRAVLRGSLAWLDAILVGTGRSAYFVPRGRAEDLARTREMFTSLSDKVEFHAVPLIDMPEQRDWVAQSLISETQLMCSRLLEDLDGETDPNKRVLGDAMDKLRQVKARTREYTELLEISDVELQLSTAKLESAINKAIATVAA